MKPTLAPGIEHEFTYRVPRSKLVPALYPESDEFAAMPDVFATGFLVGLVEWTCIQAVHSHIDWPAEQTVGTHVDLSHTAATPPGLEVTVNVKLVEVDGRRLMFEFAAHDGIDSIGAGTHERFVIVRETFDAKVAKKAKTADA